MPPFLAVLPKQVLRESGVSFNLLLGAVRQVLVLILV